MLYVWISPYSSRTVTLVLFSESRYGDTSFVIFVLLWNHIVSETVCD